MVMVFIPTQMVDHTKDNGRMANNTVKASLLLLKVPKEEESGMKEKGQNGLTKMKSKNNKNKKWKLVTNEVRVYKFN